MAHMASGVKMGRSQSSRTHMASQRRRMAFWFVGVWAGVGIAVCGGGGDGVGEGALVDICADGVALSSMGVA